MGRRRRSSRGRGGSGSDIFKMIVILAAVVLFGVLFITQGMNGSIVVYDWFGVSQYW